MKTITSYLKNLYKKLTRESQILNVQSIKGIYDFIYFSLGIMFLLRIITNIIQQKYLQVIANGIGLLFPSFLKYFRNNKIVTYYIMVSFFWYATLLYAIYAYFSDMSLDLKVRNIWFYESIMNQITPLLSLKYQIIQKIVFHILCGRIGIYNYDEMLIQVLDYLIVTVMVVFNIKSIYLNNIHIEKEFKKKKFYEKILFNQPGYSYKLGKNSKEQIFIKESNNEKSFKEFVQNLSSYNLAQYLHNILNLLEYEHQLPYKAMNIFDVLFILIHENIEERQQYKITAISNKGKPNQKKFKMLIMKQQENFQNIIFLRINELDNEERKQEELIKTRELMFNSINHDVKNPLIAGSYLIDQIIKQNSSVNNINQDNLDCLKHYIDISLSLINGYFDYSLAQLGNLKLQPEKFNLYEPILNTIKMMQYLAQKKSVHLKSKFDIKKIYVKNDLRRLSQVLMNLINNAIKFTLKGGDVIVELEEFICYNLIYITVTDNGVGMSPEILQQIGQLYATFNNQNMNIQGTGIGLYTSQKTVSLLGPFEKIFVSSVEGQGSQFSFFIYLNVDDIQIQSRIQSFNNDIRQILLYLRQHEVIVDKQGDISEICIPEEYMSKSIFKKNDFFQLLDNIGKYKSQASKQLTILVVDDDDLIRYATINAIKNLGKEKYNILQAENGQIGVDLFKIHNQDKNQTTIDIIITDIQMPELDGYQMVRQINELVENYHYQKPQIIALSSNQSDDFSQKCYDLYIDYYFTKPQSAAQIRDIIRKYENEQLILQNK